MSGRDQIKAKLKILAGLPPTGPTDSELNAIIGDIVRVKEQRVPTEADWRAAATRNVPGAGGWKYAGEDMSDLNRLLLMIQATSPQSGNSGGGATNTRK
jgi:hypothetical protein